MTGSTEDSLALGSDSPFERIKRVDSDGNEFWSARDLVPVLEYASWARFSSVLQDIYSSLCLENSSQVEMLPASVKVHIGSGAIREVEDWKISSHAINRVLSRVASAKPQAVRELRRRNSSQLRIEVEIGAVLYDFCEQADVVITHQKALGGYKFDFCIADRLLIEIDEAQHQFDSKQMRRDQEKNAVARRCGYELLRISIPVANVAKLCGVITRLLIKRETDRYERTTTI